MLVPLYSGRVLVMSCYAPPRSVALRSSPYLHRWAEPFLRMLPKELSRGIMLLFIGA